MPWLTATAFLHSSVVQSRRGMLQSWNFVLVITTFALTILGTFLTRSGVIVSVHSFSQSAIGPALLIFLVIILLGSLGLFAMRAHTIASSPRLDALNSREGVFLFNNLMLTVFAFMVLTGTLYPIFVEAMTDSTVGVGRPFFDRMAIPLSFLLLLAMGIGPIAPYRTASAQVVWERIRWPVRVALGSAALAVVLGYRNPFLLLGILTAVFVIGVLVRHLYVTAAVRADKLSTSWPKAASKVLRGDPHYWGGQISHLGIAILALGIAFSSNLSETATVSIEAGGTANFAGFELTFEEAFSRQEPGKFVSGGIITVTKDGSEVGTYEPRLNNYENNTSPISTPAVDMMPSGDLYLSLRSINADEVVLEMFWFPFIWLLWVGGFLASAAGVWAYAAKKPERVEREERTSVTDEDRARAIGSRVKCPVCQGVAIADSPSETARAMMDVVEERIAEGWSDDQIIDYFKQRYTDSIVIDPPFAGNTMLVWLLPAFAVVAGIFMISSRRKSPAPTKEEI
jgi:cytochrome c-type biogenesis protein CcmF